MFFQIETCIFTLIASFNREQIYKPTMKTVIVFSTVKLSMKLPYIGYCF